jgi:signal transduction histidine kinase
MSLQVHVQRASSAAVLLGLRESGSDASPRRGSGNRNGERKKARARILLVEDDPGIRDVLHGILEEEGYAVTTAENGQEALDTLRSSAAPDLIVLDLRMPVMDGWQFRAVQKADPMLAGIPVLAVSADGSAKAEAIDAAGYIRKPLSTESLLTTIARILGEAERQRLLRRLEEAERFAALGRLAASVGHEINNPLAYLSMNVDLAADQVSHILETQLSREQMREHLATMPALLRDCRVGLDRIRDVVKDLKSLSRDTQATRTRFSINELLDESLAMARNHVEHRATVGKQYGVLPSMIGDRSAIGQVLLNLLINAAQALPEGRAASNRITLRTVFEGGDVVIEVADTGVGISPEVLPHIFDPFYTTKPIGDGTGIGLAVSYRIVADHGGRIDVDSELGKGSVFRVVLPNLGVAGDGLPAAAHDMIPEPAILRAKILVIDDVPAIGQTIAVALSEHDVTVVSRARDAFERLAANESFDVVICDVLMPEMGGREVLERLEVDWPQLAANLIFMTGGAFTAESSEFVDSSTRRILTKPFSADELRTVVAAQLRGARRERN